MISTLPRVAGSFSGQSVCQSVGPPTTANALLHITFDHVLLMFWDLVFGEPPHDSLGLGVPPEKIAHTTSFRNSNHMTKITRLDDDATPCHMPLDGWLVGVLKTKNSWFQVRGMVTTTLS